MFITTANSDSPHAKLVDDLGADDAQTRLRTALTIGSTPVPDLLEVLIMRCAVEPNFYVRDMLTWALTRYPGEITAPRLVAELRSDNAQARSQALHTLSKIKEPGAFPAITRALLSDPNDEVARSAWRAAVVLVPDGQKNELAEALAAQLGRGNRDLQLSLSRALCALGEKTIEPVLQTAMTSANPNIQAHARVTERLLRDPNASSELAIHEAKRIFALGDKR